MTFSSKLVEPLARTVKVDFCLLLRETMPSQRPDVWAKADREGKRLSIAASNNVMRCFTMESAPLVTRDFLFDLKNGENCTPIYSSLLGCSDSRGTVGLGPTYAVVVEKSRLHLSGSTAPATMP